MRNHMRRKGNHGSDDSGMGCLVAALLGVIAMPIVGLVFVLGKDEEKKPIGWIMLVVGVILWILFNK